MKDVNPFYLEHPFSVKIYSKRNQKVHRQHQKYLPVLKLSLLQQAAM